jgi:uncharacterized protein (DUF2267 family)
MDAREFTAFVQEAAGVDERRAEHAIAATLATLADRLTAGQARDLAAQLPAEVAPWLATTDRPEPFDVVEFVRRVAEREGVDPATAERDARAVFGALGRAVSADELADMAAELPKGFAALLPRGPHVQPPSGHEFVARVARRAGLDEARARRAVETVLETLAERIAPGEADDLAARLPIELRPPLRADAAEGPADPRMPLDRFLLRAAQRERATPAEALVHGRAVFATLREVVGDDEYFDTIAQLPLEYRSALTPGDRRGGD